MSKDPLLEAVRTLAPRHYAAITAGDDTAKHWEDLTLYEREAWRYKLLTAAQDFFARQSGSSPDTWDELSNEDQAAWLLKFRDQELVSLATSIAQYKERVTRAERDSETNGDPVNHPSHYTSSPARCECGRRIECIDITEHMSFTRGNAVKYLWRAGLKGSSSELEDLRKAAWYLNREIQRLEKNSLVRNK